MRKIVETFLKYPFYANLIIVVIVVFGGISLYRMKKSAFPERRSVNLRIRVSFPGASPKEMDEGLTTRIEQAIRGIVGIKEINSTSAENSTSINIETTGEYELEETLREVKSAVDAISGFPMGAEKPVVTKRRSTTPAIRLGLTGDADLMTLKQIAQEIEDDFLRSGVISQVSVGGYPSVQISVEVPEENLMRYNLTFDEISRRISSSNKDFSGGQIKSDEEEILIRSRARSVDPNDISDIILRANPDGSLLRIRDVGVVQMKFADVSSGTWINGKRSIRIMVNKLSEEDLEEISEYVNSYIADFNSKHENIQLMVSFDFLDMLYERLTILYSNGLIGLALVVIFLGLFLNVRLSFWVAWGIPASFLAMFILGVSYGITINMMSVFGMILIIGILVDDGIVIGENIYSHFEMGKNPKRAALDGTLEVFPAVLTSICTTIVAFSPLFFLKGRMEMMKEMGFVVVFSLAFSLLEAVSVLPAHLASPRVLRKNKNKKTLRIRKYLSGAIAYLRYNIYGGMLKIIIRWKWAVLATPISLIMVSVGLFGGDIIKTTFFPTIPPDDFGIEIAFTPGSGEKKTYDYLQRFENAVWEVNEELLKVYPGEESFVKYTVVTVGSAGRRGESGSHAGSVSVELRSLEHAPISSFEISNKVRQKIGRVEEAVKFSIGAMSRWGSPVSISLLGKNLEELEQAKDFLMEELKTLPALININEANAIGKREVRLGLKPKAYFLGLDHSSISNQVRQGFFGGQSQRLQHGKDDIRVYVRYPKHKRTNLGQLETMKIKVPSGQYPLTELADYSIERGPVNILRFNSQREMRVEADLSDPYAPVPPILQFIQRTIIPELQAQYPGVEVDFRGQRRFGREATDEMSNYFTIAFGIMVLILMIHFRSFSQPLIVICMIPLALLGAAWGHGIEKIPVSMLSMWGMAALSGVIINNAVIFLSKYNSNLVEGQSVKEAVYNAGLQRFRPILLTSITTVAGLYPIIMEASRQSQFLKPMAVSLSYGVLVGTTFILIFFPVYILVLNDIKRWCRWLLTKEKPSPESVEPAIRHAKFSLNGDFENTE